MGAVDLLTPARFGRLVLRNRIVMAPMTRSRAGVNGDPTELMVEHYRQRASAGMIITEGIYPSEEGKGYCRTPGLVSPRQATLWRRVTEAVHTTGGTIVAQIQHCGRMGHPDNKAAGAETVAPSAITAHGLIDTDTDGGSQEPIATPRALEAEEIPRVIADYVRCTELAYEAGFDGVELHGTAGFLPAQFLSTGTNQRADRYGGSVENRCRFFVELAEAMAGVDGPDRVGFRILADNPFNDLHDDDPEETFSTLVPLLNPIGLAYCHTLRFAETAIDTEALCREVFDGPLIINDGYSPAEAEKALQHGRGDAVSFGRLYITNPDLVERITAGAALSPFDDDHFYNPGAEGYTTFPPMG